MNRSFKPVLIAAAAITALMLGSASAAYASPSKTSACANCHGSDPSVAVTVAQTANTGTTATYGVTVANPNGTAGWAVLSGSTNLARGTATTGTFTVPVGATYTVWGASVGGNEGASSVTINPVAAPPVVPPVVTPPVVTPPVVTPPVVAPVTPPAPVVKTGKVKVQLQRNNNRRYTIKLYDAKTKTKLTLRTTKSGKAEFKKVPYGTYKLTFKAKGKKYSKTVKVTKTKVLVKVRLAK